MVKFLSLILFMISFQLSAAIHTGKISKIDLPQNQHELPLIFLDSGKVLKIKPENKDDLAAFYTAMRNSEKLKLMTNKKRQIVAVENLGTEEMLVSETVGKIADYEPTVMASEEDAKKLFSGLRRGARSWSQCYNRAHIWSYESKLNHSVNTMKVFIFYTRKYIREYDFDWWFHVSPFTYVAAAESREERVLDYRFSKSPLSMKKWTDLFMRNRVECTPISNYSEYENNQEKAYCYLQRASMFYYQPLDLEALENSGKTKTDWVKWEVKNAYRNGFGDW